MTEPVFEKLIAALGIDCTLVLVKARGGQKIYVPSRQISPTHWLITMIGREKTLALVEIYGGESIEVPRIIPYDLRARDIEICRRAALGKKARELAQEYHVSVRWVRRILKMGGSSSP